MSKKRLGTTKFGELITSDKENPHTVEDAKIKYEKEGDDWKATLKFPSGQTGVTRVRDPVELSLLDTIEKESKKKLNIERD